MQEIAIRIVGPTRNLEYFRIKPHRLNVFRNLTK